MLACMLCACTVGQRQRSRESAPGAYHQLTPADRTIFDTVQRATFRYFWDGAEPNSGLARERIHLDHHYPQRDSSVVTSGGGGFGVMALIVGMDRGWIGRREALARFDRILGFLETADRFHGAWPHWWQGETGRVKPFSRYDDGGDLVETSFMLQGLLCLRQYLKDGSREERSLARRADSLWRSVEFDWYRNGRNVLYWHWSPVHGWKMNFAVRGYNECLILYILAASSPTHGVPPEVYHEGWARGGGILDNPPAYGGVRLRLAHQGGHAHGGPLFWAHYSYLGLDPRGLKDRYADYWAENLGLATIHHQWCVDNPLGFKGYGPESWGLTSSYSMRGYSGHAPSTKSDLGVISPTAALSSFPYTPVWSMEAMRHWYGDMRGRIFGPYGFHDAFSESADWYLPRYLAIDQGPIVVMMENHRSGLLWRLFMSCPEIHSGLRKLGFESPWLH
jgi:hypothetical protein